MSDRVRSFLIHRLIPAFCSSCSVRRSIFAGVVSVCLLTSLSYSTQEAFCLQAFEVTDPSAAHSTSHDTSSPQNEAANHQMDVSNEEATSQEASSSSHDQIGRQKNLDVAHPRRFKVHKVARWKNSYLIPELKKIHPASPDQTTPLDAGKNPVDTSTDLIYGLSVDQGEKEGLYPPYTSSTMCLLATGNGEELFSRHIYNPTAMASLTKIMTALVASDLAVHRSDQVSISAEAAAVSGSQIGYLTGDTPTADELMKGLLIHSGNDAALALSQAFMTTPEFLERMNQKARDLGCYDTQFESPHGLDSQNHFSTVRDLYVLAHTLMENSYLRGIVGTRQLTLNVHGVEKTFHNTNPLLGTYRGITGIKTGYTDRAGYALISSCTQDDITLYAVVLGTHSFKERESESKKLLDWGYSHYPYQQLAGRGDYLGKLAYPYRFGWFYPVTVLKSTSYRFAVDEKPLAPEFSPSYLRHAFAQGNTPSTRVRAYLSSLTQITKSDDEPTSDKKNPGDVKLAAYCCPTIGSPCPQIAQSARYDHLSQNDDENMTRSSYEWRDGLITTHSSLSSPGIFSFQLMNRLKIAEGDLTW